MHTMALRLSYVLLLLIALLWGSFAEAGILSSIINYHYNNSIAGSQHQSEHLGIEESENLLGGISSNLGAISNNLSSATNVLNGAVASQANSIVKDLSGKVEQAATVASHVSNKVNGVAGKVEGFARNVKDLAGMLKGLSFDGANANLTASTNGSLGLAQLAALSQRATNGTSWSLNGLANNLNGTVQGAVNSAINGAASKLSDKLGGYFNSAASGKSWSLNGTFPGLSRLNGGESSNKNYKLASSGASNGAANGLSWSLNANINPFGTNSAVSNAGSNGSLSVTSNEGSIEDSNDSSGGMSNDANSGAVNGGSWSWSGLSNRFNGLSGASNSNSVEPTGGSLNSAQSSASSDQQISSPLGGNSIQTSNDGSDNTNNGASWSLSGLFNPFKSGQNSQQIGQSNESTQLSALNATNNGASWSVNGSVNPFGNMSFGWNRTENGVSDSTNGDSNQVTIGNSKASADGSEKAGGRWSLSGLINPFGGNAASGEVSQETNANADGGTANEVRWSLNRTSDAGSNGGAEKGRSSGQISTSSGQPATQSENGNQQAQAINESNTGGRWSLSGLMNPFGGNTASGIASNRTIQQATNEIADGGTTNVVGWSFNGTSDAVSNSGVEKARNSGQIPASSDQSVTQYENDNQQAQAINRSDTGNGWSLFSPFKGLSWSRASTGKPNEVAVEAPAQQLKDNEEGGESSELGVDEPEEATSGEASAGWSLRRLIYPFGGSVASSTQGTLQLETNGNLADGTVNGISWSLNETSGGAGNNGGVKQIENVFNSKQMSFSSDQPATSIQEAQSVQQDFDDYDSWASFSPLGNLSLSRTSNVGPGGLSIETSIEKSEESSGELGNDEPEEINQGGRWSLSGLFNQGNSSSNGNVRKEAEALPGDNGAKEGSWSIYDKVRINGIDETVKEASIDGSGVDTSQGLVQVGLNGSAAIAGEVNGEVDGQASINGQSRTAQGLNGLAEAGQAFNGGLNANKQGNGIISGTVNGVDNANSNGGSIQFNLAQNIPVGSLNAQSGLSQTGNFGGLVSQWAKGNAQGGQSFSLSKDAFNRQVIPLNISQSEMIYQNFLANLNPAYIYLIIPIPVQQMISQAQQQNLANQEALLGNAAFEVNTVAAVDSTLSEAEQISADTQQAEASEHEQSEIQIVTDFSLDIKSLSPNESTFIENNEHSSTSEKPVGSKTIEEDVIREFSTSEFEIFEDKSEVRSSTESNDQAASQSRLRSLISKISNSLG